MNKFQLIHSLPEPSPEIEIVREHMGEDGYQYNAYYVRQFNIEDQIPLYEMQDWFIDEQVGMIYLGWAQTDFDAEAAEQDKMIQDEMDRLGYEH